MLVGGALRNANYFGLGLLLLEMNALPLLLAAKYLDYR